MPMSPPDGSAPIVVGIDAGPGAADALAWAAAEAGAQHCPLRVVHVFTLPNLMDPYGLLPADDTGFCRVRDAAAQVVREAVTAVKAQHCHLVPRCEQFGGDRRVAAGQRRQPFKQPNRDQVQQLQAHGR